MGGHKKRLLIMLVLLQMTLLLGGCAEFTEKKTAKVRDLEYTVVKQQDIPEELMREIEADKNTNFKLTYSDGEFLYIANGYGEQETNGYSIQMKELYLTANAIYFKSELHGPENGEKVSKTASYPYIVIKTEVIDFPVVFE